MQDLLLAALDNAPALIWIADPDGRAIHFNRTWLDFTGRTLEEERGTGWRSGIHPDDVGALEKEVEALRRRETFRSEYRLRRRDGEWRWILDVGQPFLMPDGTFAGYIGTCTEITDRKTAEESLRLEQQRLQLAQEAAGIGIYDWDIASNRITWSAHMFQLHGIDPSTPSEEIYLRWLERLHPDDRERVDAETRRLVEEADHLSIEFRVVHPDGNVRWIYGRGRTVRDADGRPVRMIGINIDFTERRRAEEALRESEQRLRDIAENFPGIIFRRITYPDGRFEYPYFSGADDSVFQVSRERLATIRTMEDAAGLIHYDDVEGMLTKFRNAAASLSPLNLEGRVVGEDGTIRWVRSLSRPRPREDGALVWDGVLLDVTEQHGRETERERAAAMLRMGMVLAGIGTWEYDPATEMVTASAVTNAIFGIPDEGEARPREDYMRSVHRDDVSWVRQGLVDGAVRKESISREYRVLAADGSVRWVASSASVVSLADGTERMIGALYDVTERKQQDKDREAALQHQQMLLNELNHRIKNNLQMITSMLRLQAGRLPDHAGAQELSRATDRVQAIADLHAQLSFEGGYGRIDFGTYLAQLAEKLRRSVLAETPVEITCATEHVMLDLDCAVPLGLIVNELVTNAIKYAFPLNRPGTIAVALQCHGRQSLIIQIADTGAGVVKEETGRRGLGMQLVEGLCRQIGAKIERSTEGGISYLLTIPIAGDE
jgi:PAS domain S-box-containing protein